MGNGRLARLARPLESVIFRRAEQVHETIDQTKILDHTIVRYTTKKQRKRRRRRLPLQTQRKQSRQLELKWDVVDMTVAQQCLKLLNR